MTPNKFTKEKVQKTNAGCKSQDICQELRVTCGHTKASFSGISRILQKTMKVRRYK